ncbi:MAG: lytic transglycosylase domain-containing protein [Pyrinomonadaceae bacterium]
MTNPILKSLMLMISLVVCAAGVNAQREAGSTQREAGSTLRHRRNGRAQTVVRPAASETTSSETTQTRSDSTQTRSDSTQTRSDTTPTARMTGKRIKYADGSTLDVDEAWKQGEDVWYRQGGVTRSVVRKVHSIEPILAKGTAREAIAQSRVKPADHKTRAEKPTATWLSLVGGARFKVDEVKETSDGAWYSRGNLLIFLERERIARIDRDLPNSGGSGRRGMDWTSGNPLIDQLIKTNGTLFGIDPYLVFLVIEQESHFHPRAVSPKGARGLMQLMPGTAARFGVRRPFDPLENIRGGTQYLKELMGMFGGRVDLVLASYNAGEGAVVRFGRKVPPYRETQDYVRRISKRYQAGEPTDVKP